MILARDWPDLVAFAMTALGPKDEFRAPEKANGAQHANGGEDGSRSQPSNPTPTLESMGVAQPKAAHAMNGPGVKPRESAARRDQALLELMRANADATVTEIIRLNGRPRNSTMASLERLEKGGSVSHESRGIWKVIDETPPPKRSNGWLEPLSGKRVARHAADGRIRDELTLSGGAEVEH
jgi:hypothetical protein